MPDITRYPRCTHGSCQCLAEDRQNGTFNDTAPCRRHQVLRVAPVDPVVVAAFSAAASEPAWSPLRTIAA